MTAKQIKLEIENIKQTVSAVDPFKVFKQKSMGTADLKKLIEEQKEALTLGIVASEKAYDRKQIQQMI